MAGAAIAAAATIIAAAAMVTAAAVADSNGIKIVLRKRGLNGLRFLNFSGKTCMLY